MTARLITQPQDEDHRQHLIRQITSFLHKLESKLHTWRIDRLAHTYNALILITQERTAHEQWVAEQRDIWQALATAANAGDTKAFQKARRRLLNLFGGRNWQVYYKEAQVLSFMPEQGRKRLARLATRLEKKGAEQ
jgi:hypothetical protein